MRILIFLGISYVVDRIGAHRGRPVSYGEYVGVMLGLFISAFVARAIGIV